MSSDFSSIADANMPNAGRIYDYLLGGNHNFEVDRIAAKQLVQIAPFMPQLFKLIRWFLGEVVIRLSNEGFTHFIDFASGLPTVDHIHQITPEGTKVIYSDIDPVVVTYANEILKDNPNTRYIQCEAGKPETLLESPVVKELFGENRRVAIGFNGIAYFLPDKEIKHFMETTYRWADEGSKLFLCDADATTTPPESATKIMEIYKKINQPLYPRPLKVLKDLIKPWEIEEPGFMLLEEWVDIKTKVTEDVKKQWKGQGFYGAILKK